MKSEVTRICVPGPQPVLIGLGIKSTPPELRPVFCIYSFAAATTGADSNPFQLQQADITSWGQNSAVEYLHSMHKAQGSIPSTSKGDEKNISQGDQHSTGVLSLTPCETPQVPLDQGSICLSSFPKPPQVWGRCLGNCLLTDHYTVSLCAAPPNSIPVQGCWVLHSTLLPMLATAPKTSVCLMLIAK